MYNPSDFEPINKTTEHVWKVEVGDSLSLPIVMDLYYNHGTQTFLVMDEKCNTIPLTRNVGYFTDKSAFYVAATPKNAQMISNIITNRTAQRAAFELGQGTMVRIQDLLRTTKPNDPKLNKVLAVLLGR